MLDDARLRSWISSILIVTASLAGMLYVTGVLASSDGPEIVPPTQFLEVKPMNRCAPGEGAGPRAAQTIFRGGRPDEQSLRYLQAIGIKSIENIEIPSAVSDEEKLEQDLGLSFHDVAHPMTAGLGINTLPDGSDDDESVIEAVSELRKPQNFPIYIHCHHGNDRTGMVVALHRVFDECWSPKDAQAEWRQIAGPWNSFWDFEKFQYFQKVMADPNLHQRYLDELNKLAPPMP